MGNDFLRKVEARDRSLCASTQRHIPFEQPTSTAHGSRGAATAPGRTILQQTGPLSLSPDELRHVYSSLRHPLATTQPQEQHAVGAPLLDRAMSTSRHYYTDTSSSVQKLPVSTYTGDPTALVECTRRELKRLLSKRAKQYSRALSLRLSGPRAVVPRSSYPVAKYEVIPNYSLDALSKGEAQAIFAKWHTEERLSRNEPLNSRWTTSATLKRAPLRSFVPACERRV